MDQKFVPVSEEYEKEQEAPVPAQPVTEEVVALNASDSEPTKPTPRKRRRAVSTGIITPE
jgi:hypothetical protein